MAPRNDQLILARLEKAVHSGNITAVVPEDLEIEAHSTLWNETDPYQLTLLKLLPSVDAKSVTHEYSRVVSYGRKRSSGFFNERALPPESNFRTERIEVEIRLMGEIGPTFLLAALEKTQQALGTSGAQNIERVALRLSVLEKKNRNLYYADTRTTRDGTSSTRFKGVMQLIEEGTDTAATGFSGVDGKGSPFGSHIVDMEGDPLNMDTLREKWSQGILLYGTPSCLVMDPLARGDFEASMDPAQRLGVPTTFAPLVIGQNIAGIKTQGGTLWFESDLALSPIYGRPQYTADLEDDAPSGTPTVVAAAGADGTSAYDSKWDSDTAGEIFYVVTEMVDEIEGEGTRYPASTAAFVTVASGEEVTLTLTRSSSEVQSFKVYRGREEDGQSALVDAWFVFEVACTAAVVTAYDDNLYRPNTSWAFALNLDTPAVRALHSAAASGTASPYEAARLQSASFLGAEGSKRNTIAVANLGPQMGIMALASVLAEVDRPLVYSACAPEVRNPFQNFVFVNVGRA